MLRINFYGTAATDARIATDGERLVPRGVIVERGIPVLLKHDTSKIVGEIVRIMPRDDKVMVFGWLEIDDTHRDKQLLDSLRTQKWGMSVMFQEIERAEYCVSKWRMLEVSLTRTPADKGTSFVLGDPVASPAAKSATVRRAYSLLAIKRADDDSRTITGLATSASTDHMGDIVEPAGAEFKLPLPLLLHHNPTHPIGHVTRARATGAGIAIEAQILKTDQPGPVKDRLDGAWQDIRLGLVRGLSIGFKPLEVSRLKDGGLRFIRWAWLELSAVTVAANQDASITAVKSAIAAAPAREPLDPDVDALFTGLRKATGLRGERLGCGLAKLMGKFSAPLVARVKALEAERKGGSGLRYLGVWRDRMDCRRGDIVTHQGQLWHCRDETTQPPGTEDWQLMHKRAR